MKYFLILGRNPELSYAEIISVLQRNQIGHITLLFQKNFLIMDIDGKFPDIQEFGGIIKGGEVQFNGDDDGFNDYLQAWEPAENKFRFSVAGNYVGEVQDVLMKKFEQDGIRAQIKRTRKNLSLQGGDSVELAKADKEFFFFKTEKDFIYFGEATEAYSYTDVKARDMRKPVRRESLAISPRLAKMLVNLTQARPGQLLLDPFCGIGAILQEAMAKGINVYGVDNDKLAIENAQRNMKWFSKEYSAPATFRLMNEDSAKIKNITPDAIATESPLGEVVRRKLTDHKAKEYIEKFEKAIIPILRNLRNIKKPYAKIAITMPFIRTTFVNLENVCRLTGLRVCHISEDVSFPIQEYREDQFVAREIVLLE